MRVSPRRNATTWPRASTDATSGLRLVQVNVGEVSPRPSCRAALSRSVSPSASSVPVRGDTAIRLFVLNGAATRELSPHARVRNATRARRRVAVQCCRRIVPTCWCVSATDRRAHRLSIYRTGGRAVQAEEGTQGANCGLRRVLLRKLLRHILLTRHFRNWKRLFRGLPAGSWLHRPAIFFAGRRKRQSDPSRGHWRDVASGPWRLRLVDDQPHFTGRCPFDDGDANSADFDVAEPTSQFTRNRGVQL